MVMEKTLPILFPASVVGSMPRPLQVRQMLLADPPVAPEESHTDCASAYLPPLAPLR